MKTIFMQRKGLETMIYDIMRGQGVSREAAVREINELIKAAEPDAELLVLEEFSVRNADTAKR